MDYLSLNLVQLHSEDHKVETVEAFCAAIQEEYKDSFLVTLVTFLWFTRWGLILTLPVFLVLRVRYPKLRKRVSKETWQDGQNRCDHTCKGAYAVGITNGRCKERWIHSHLRWSKIPQQGAQRTPLSDDDSWRWRLTHYQCHSVLYAWFNKSN